MDYSNYNAHMRFDRTDRHILSELQRKGRLPIVDLAGRVGLSSSPCLRRVRQLEKQGVIKGYGAFIDHHKLGMDIVGYIEVNLNQADTEAFHVAVLKEPAIIECYALSGSFDYLLKVAVSDLEAFGALTMRKILRYPGVNSITSSLILQALKEQVGFPVL